MSDEELTRIRENIDHIAALADYPTVPMNRDSLVREVRALLEEVGRLRGLLRTAQTFLDERDEANAELRAEVERLRRWELEEATELLALRAEVDRMRAALGEWSEDG